MAARLRIIRVVLISALCVAVSTSAGVGQAATSSTVVSLTVPSATTLSATGCASATAGVTDFGTVQPGSPAVTSADCVVGFGSSNDTSTLRLARLDANASAMRRWAPGVLPSGTATTLRDLAAASRSVMWMTGNGGTIRKSTDGGQTWAAQTSNLLANIMTLEVGSTTDVWVAGVDGAFARTTDGGTNWTALTIPATGNDYRGIEWLGGQTLLMVGGEGVVGSALRSTDGGTTWTDVSHATMENQAAVEMATSTIGWSVGQSTDIHKTTDGGLTWTTSPRCGTNQLRDIAVISTSIVIAVGHLGTICRTTDGGATWGSIASGTTANLWEIDRAPDGTLWTVGYANAGTAPILRSTDDGLTWTQVATNAQNLEGVIAWDRESATWAGWAGSLEAIPSGSFDDYGSVAGATWGGTGDMFGVCLRAASNVTPVWTIQASCTTSDAAHWQAVPASTSLAASRVATTAGSVVTGEARFRFGFRPSAAVTPGRYTASLNFEVVAPTT